MSLWPLYLAIFMISAVGLLIFVVLRLRRQPGEEAEADADGAALLTEMAPSEWDHYLEQLFSALGYRVERPRHRNDLSPDLILIEAGGRRVAVRARHGQGQIGVEAVQHVVSASAAAKCHESMIISAGGYTRQARQVATRTGTHLWDLADLAAAAEQAQAHPKPRARPVPAVASGGGPVAPPFGAAAVSLAAASQSPQGPVCPRCNAPMTLRAAAGREIWLCSRFPKCNHGALKRN